MEAGVTSLPDNSTNNSNNNSNNISSNNTGAVVAVHKEDIHGDNNAYLGTLIVCTISNNLFPSVLRIGPHSYTDESSKFIGVVLFRLFYFSPCYCSD